MWFKNLILYRFNPAALELTPDQLQAQLEPKRFAPCGSTQTFSYGWTAPLGTQPDRLVYNSNGYWLIRSRREDKILPASVVHEFADERALELEEQSGRKLNRKELKQLREEITQELLPKAFTRSSYCSAYFDLKQGWLVVDSASSKKAEELTTHLRTCLGSLPIKPPKVKQPLATEWRTWVLQGTPATMELGDECVLSDQNDQGGVIRCKGQALDSDEIRGHLEAGKQFTRVALTWDKRLSFVLGDDLSLKRLQFEDVVADQADEADTLEQQFDTDFSLMTLELSRLLPALMDVFGGESAL